MSTRCLCKFLNNLRYTFRCWQQEMMKLKMNRKPSLLIAVLKCFKWQFLFGALGFSLLVINIRIFFKTTEYLNIS